MEIFKVGGTFFAHPEKVVSISPIIAGSSDKVLIVISAVKEITRILKMINLANSTIGLKDDFKTIQFNFLYGLFDNIHLDLIERLFSGECQKKMIEEFYLYFSKLKDIIHEKRGLDAYHQILQYGEFISSAIYHRYYESIGVKNVLINAPDYVMTSYAYGDQAADIIRIDERLSSLFTSEESNHLFLTQGFIGTDKNNRPTTLGDDGSDYSAAKFAEFLNRYVPVDLITYVKDVRGVYTEDPKKNPFAKVFSQLSLAEYEKYSQSNYVVRPDAIATSAAVGIPTVIRSFNDWKDPGTVIK